MSSGSPLRQLGLGSTKAREDVDLAKWAWASRPRPVAPDHEIAMVTEAGDGTLIEEPTVLKGIGLLMHHTGGVWLVAGAPDVSPPSEPLGLQPAR